jgi:hypothetical protein
MTTSDLRVETTPGSEQPPGTRNAHPGGQNNPEPPGKNDAQTPGSRQRALFISSQREILR